MSRPANPTSRPAPSREAQATRTRRLGLGITGMLMLIAAGAFWMAQARRVVPIPEIPTARLDPAVARLIRRALAETGANPRSDAAWGKLGSVLLHYEFTEASGQAFAQAQKLAPMDPRWPYLHGLMLLPRDAETALSRLERAVTLAPRNEVALWRLAQSLADRGRDAEAQRRFEALLRLNPDHPPGLLGLARLKQRQGHFDQATNLTVRCLADPHTARGAHLLVTAIQRTTGDLSAAIRTAQRLETLPADEPWPDPWWSEALAFRIGRKAQLEAINALVDQGRLQEALPALALVEKDYPADEEVTYLKGWALNQSQQFGEAEGTLRRHLALSPRSAKGHAQLGVALLGQRQYETAIGILRAGLQLKPTWREFHSNLGFACVQLGRMDEAILHYREAWVQDPNHAPSGTALGELLARRGDRAEARQVLRQTLELSPSNSRARTLLEPLERDAPKNTAPQATP